MALARINWGLNVVKDRMVRITCVWYTMRRPTKWAVVRVCVLGVLLPWFIPMPWQTADKDARYTGVLPTPTLIEWCESNGGCHYNVSNGETP